MPELQYQTGFGNEFATEAVAGVLPKGQSAPQKVALGLYAELWTGTAFTAPRATNRRTWVYRINPSAKHKPFVEIPTRLLRSGPFDEVPTPPTQLRWDPLPLPEAETPTDFIDGLITLGGNGDPSVQSGMALHMYAANASMTDRFFYDADGELLIVPQLGSIRVFTELGMLDVSPGHICVVPRGLRFRVELLDPAVRGLVVENYGPAFRLPELGPIGSNGLANPRDFRSPVAAFEDREGTLRQDAKFLGRLWTAEIDHSPLDVVAWHGNYAPYKSRPRGLRGVEHGDLRSTRPVHLHRPHRPHSDPRHRQRRLCGVSPALDRVGAHVQAPVVPPQRLERVPGAHPRRVSRQIRRLCAWWCESPQLHDRPRTGCGIVRKGARGRRQARIPCQYAGRAG